jgi:hypothetical protein
VKTTLNSFEYELNSWRWSLNDASKRRLLREARGAMTTRTVPVVTLPAAPEANLGKELSKDHRENPQRHDAPSACAERCVDNIQGVGRRVGADAIQPNLSAPDVYCDRQSSVDALLEPRDTQEGNRDLRQPSRHGVHDGLHTKNLCGRRDVFSA